MKFTHSFLIFFVLFFSGEGIQAQNTDTIRRIEACICSESSIPLAWTHIINLSTGKGSISDSSGNFSLNVSGSDSILFRNLAYEELIIPSRQINSGDTVHLRIKYHPIEEVKIFEWGSTYADFKAKMKSMPVTENLGEKLGLPQQSGSAVPNYRNPEVLSNPLFAITNPVDFLYFNLSKKEQSIRKVMEFKQNEELIRKFESVYNRKSIAVLTGLDDEKLDLFLVYLNLNFTCDIYCTELQIATEIYRHWKVYGELKN